ncbi:MAG: metalloregulator ArsR/SmtB family transcription factor [Brevundimonas sp.]|uniref:ArsR/SmtB family transcription factor n=1 Tax=Brevundimonas sp. TaxID=1871086 RepID=UPI002735D1CD|nr:metalloregulator ArsR/SmtB family transcription factor [Brevundimonas sp.]MDP3658054.1 metalloregulator ArsR/SmtB family transcription factor [Brevundimonas sp.]MDZ4067318.1 metalloregulator ArsR/SmtB family transcription factor [Tabrizicola sp.]MDZ4320114.1 metalloregulator ArsR/SmtB family transcription factor [Phenylobacterium sp.]
MEMTTAVESLSALAHEGRLKVFRLLVTAGSAGLAAGEIARRLGTPPNTLSANLALLAHAGLAQSRRDGRSIIYSARFDRMGELMAWLAEDCCGGAPEVCGPLAAASMRSPCLPPEA